jgi:hypothetical protein
MIRISEQRTLNPRVRGSSPWRRTRSDLGFYYSRLFFTRPFCLGFLAVLDPCLLAGRMLGPGRLVQFRPIGLDQPEERVPTMVTQRDIRRKESRSRAAPSQRFHI